MHSVDYYEVGSRVLKVENADEVLARIGRDFLRGFHLNNLGASSNAEVDCLISLTSGPQTPLPAGIKPFKIQRGQCYLDGPRMVLNVDESQIEVESGFPSRVSVRFGNSSHARHPVAVVNVLSYALPAALRRCLLYEVHSAAVVEPETGFGLLLVGDSNSGKSSLTVRLAHAGWKYLTDDMVVIRNGGRHVEALALRKVFAVSPQSIAIAGLDRLNSSLGTSVRSDRNKRRLEPSEVFPELFTSVCRPGVLCFVSIAGSETSHFEEISQSDAMIRMVNHCAWSSYDEHGAADFLKTLGRLVAQARCFVLAGGRDILDIPQRSVDIFREMLELETASEWVAEAING